MHINEIVCQACAEAGLPQRHSWRETKRYGILVCGICQQQTDIRKQHALDKGCNKWFRRVAVLGKTALRCNTDGKWVLGSWKEAKMRAHDLGKFPYRSPDCGEIHLASTPVRM